MQPLKKDEHPSGQGEDWLLNKTGPLFFVHSHPMDDVAIYDSQTSRRTTLASQVLFIYDSLLCLKREYKYVWRTRWTPGKGLYLLNRYFPLTVNSWLIFSPYIWGTNPSPKFCRDASLLEAYFSMVEIAVAQATMAVRTNALYRDYWWAKWLLVTVTVLTVGGNVLLYSLYRPVFHYYGNPVPGGLTGCILDMKCVGCDKFSRLWWVPQVTFDFLVFFMTLIHAVKHAKLRARTHLLNVLYRDGYMYFAVILSTELAQLILWNTKAVSKFAMFYSYTRSLQNMLACRLFLNLRGVLTKPSQLTISQNSPQETLPLTAIAFVPGLTDSSATAAAVTTYDDIPQRNALP